MKLIDRTFDSAARNLACDEALLDLCDEGALSGALRFWEPTETFVVVGYGNRVAAEVRVGECERRGIGVTRRCSGGGTVVQTPGCLNVALVLPLDHADALATLRGANAYVMNAHAATLEALSHRPVRVQGHTDLTIDGRKFSGNSSRRRRNAVLFHGSILLNADLELIDALLRHPSREPDYRAGRKHRAFLTNLGGEASVVKRAFAKRWNAVEPLKSLPIDRIERLAREQYENQEWTFRR